MRNGLANHVDRNPAFGTESYSTAEGESNAPHTSRLFHVRGNQGEGHSAPGARGRETGPSIMENLWAGRDKVSSSSARLTLRCKARGWE